MIRTLNARLPQHVGETVEVSGWLHRRRELKNVTFLVLRDRSGLAQAVLSEPVGLAEETVLRVRGQRLHRYEDYLAALAERGEPVGPYEGYLSAFAHGMPLHGGFALRLERWVARLTGADNVRRSTLFPRDLHRLTP